MSQSAFDMASSGSRLSYSCRRRQYCHWASVLFLICADMLSFGLAILLFRIGRSVPALLLLSQEFSWQTPIDIIYVLATLFILIRYISGDYSRRGLFWEAARSTTVSLFFASLPCFIILVALPTRYSKVAEIGTWTFLAFAIPMLRQAARIGMKHIGLWQLPTAIIARGAYAADVYTALKSNLSLGCGIRWLSVENWQDGPWQQEPGLKRLTLSDPLEIAETLAREGCDQAVVVVDDMQSSGFSELVQRLTEAEIGVLFIPSFRRLPLVGVSTSYFFGKDILLFQIRSSLQHFPSRFSKRLFDIVVALIALILLSPFFILLMIIVKSHDSGPAFYAQKRTGRHGKPFRCLKFRTMAVNADERLHRWRQENPALYEQFIRTFKLTDDPRITTPGKWLRKTSIDELPQLVNVLLGDMSLVGPRPVLERELVEHYGPAAQLYKRVRPGITGLWQVRGRSDTTYEERVHYDEWYILNWSFWYDIVIILQTAWAVILRKGAY